MKQRSIKFIMTICMTLGVLVCSNATVLAGNAYKQESGSAGSVSVIVEAGFNGKTAYSYVSASDYVNANMSGTIRYTNSNGGANSLFQGGFEEQMYGRLERTCEGNVIQILCTFLVASADGEYENIFIAR